VGDKFITPSNVTHSRLTSENEALVREHLRAAKERLVTLDDAAVNAFLAVHLVRRRVGRWMMDD